MGEAASRQPMMTEVWQRRKRFKKRYYADAYPAGNTLWHLYRNGRSRCGRPSLGELLEERAEMPTDAVCYLCRRQQALWGQRDSVAILPRKQAA